MGGVQDMMMTVHYKVRSCYDKDCDALPQSFFFFFLFFPPTQAKRFISELSRIADHTSSSTFTVQQLRDIVKVESVMESLRHSPSFIINFIILQRIGLQVRCFEDFIYSLNNQNYLLKKGPKLYQLQTASCL